MNNSNQNNSDNLKQENSVKTCQSCSCEPSLQTESSVQEFDEENKGSQICSTDQSSESQNSVIAQSSASGLAPFVTEYYIAQMDCGAEEQLIRMALAESNHIYALKFKLSERTLLIFHEDSPAPITNVLDDLGLGTTLKETKVNLEHVSIEQPHEQRKILYLLLFINFLMFFLESITGWISASTGLIADSLDMFADAAVYGMALYVVGKSSQHQLRAAHFAGYLQLGLAVLVIVDVLRRFWFGSEPASLWMIGIGCIALIANITCLLLISKHRHDGSHMKASYIFSANDVLMNLGVIVAGGLVLYTGSNYPDLIIGLIVAVLVMNGALKILKLKS